MITPVSRRRLSGAYLRLALLPLACVTGIAEATPEEKTPIENGDVEFDEHMLKLRGIDPALAGYFRKAPRFTAGRHVVALSVNGRSIGRASARFDERGALCVDKALLDAANVALPRTNLFGTPGASEDSCVDMASIYPQANAAPDPGKVALSLVVPTHALHAAPEALPVFERGGVAALMNYDIVGLESRRGSRGNRYGSANTELGFNAGDWMVRSRQVSTFTDGHHGTGMLDTYAQRSFAERRAVLQVGQINLVNPALSGAQITGAQVMSEQALAVQGNGGLVEGVAQSQSRVEVRQDGVLVYSTVVPAGPFELTDIPRINRRADLDVTVVGAGGESQRFTVTAAMAGATAPAAGYSFAAGRVRNTGGGNAPWVMGGGWSGMVQRRFALSGGAMAASHYRAVGAGFGTQAASGSQWQLDLTASSAPREHVAGAQVTLTLSQVLGDSWSFGLSHARQGSGFRELLDTTWATDASRRRVRYRDQSSASLSWSHPEIGSLSAGYSRSVLFDGRGTRRVLASWGTRLGAASVSLSAEWSLGQKRRSRTNNSVYLHVSVPLGESRRLGTSVRRYAGETRYGANFSDQINDYTAYRAGLEYRSGDHRRSLTTAVSLLPRYFQMDAGYARDPRSSSYNLALRGGVVLHGHGLTASPYAVRDTFGVLSVGDAGGIRVTTPSGPVWTDARGYAVLPQLSPYGKSHIEVATDSLPRNVDIQNGASVIEAGRGAVTTLNFGVRKTRRVLLSARTAEGIVLPAGASVTDDEGELVGLVQGRGEIFVPNALTTPRMWVDGPGLPRCVIDLSPAEPGETGAYFQSEAAVCRATGREAP